MASGPWKKSADEVRQILGKPDVVTQAECCYTRRGVSPPPVEVWLYYVEIEENYDYPRSPGEPERKILPQAFKLYFSEDNPGRFYIAIGERNGDHSQLMPVVGAIKF